MRQLVTTLLIIVVLSLITACGNESKTSTPPPTEPNVTPLAHDGLPLLIPNTPEATEHLAGGDATTFVFNQDAFAQRPSAITSDFTKDANFNSGDHIFRTPEANGIGPLFNEKTCQGCHLRDGRGVVPKNSDEPMHSMFLRISDSQGKPDPIYGDQLQTFGIESFTPDTTGLPKYQVGISSQLAVGEAYASVEYEEITGNFADGESYSLRQPIYKVRDLSYGTFINDVRFSPRVTPSIFGSGLLEAIPETSLLKLQDISDANNDGISGRIAYVMDTLAGKKAVGRFGYKAANPSVLQQISGAFRGDIGLTNTVFPDESCTDAQTACTAAAQLNKTTESPELSAHKLALVEFYNRVLAIPARRGYNNSQWDNTILAGREQFFAAQCHSCHTPRHITATANGSVLGEVTIVGLTNDAAPIEVLSNQIIFPFTDLLLHDMGGQCLVTRELADGTHCEQGEQCQYVQRCTGLADARPEGDATGTEWKTPALWGLGLVTVVNPRATFLHDGRARNISEAILWHGGEAQQSADYFKQMTKTERELLLGFLSSL